jgi:hypothetical protein
MVPTEIGCVRIQRSRTSLKGISCENAEEHESEIFPQPLENVDQSAIA